jgi:hypothetical protein
VSGASEGRCNVYIGALDLLLDTRTGQPLPVVSSLDVFAQSMGYAAWSNVVEDFGRSFDADLFLPGARREHPRKNLGVCAPVPGAVWGLGIGAGPALHAAAPFLGVAPLANPRGPRTLRRPTRAQGVRFFA